MDDELAARVAFFTWLRLITGGLDLADQICKEPCAIKQQGLSQAFLQPPDIAYCAGVYFLKGVFEDGVGFAVFFVGSGFLEFFFAGSSGPLRWVRVSVRAANSSLS